MKPVEHLVRVGQGGTVSDMKTGQILSDMILVTPDWYKINKLDDVEWT